jgi:hypothetical protein
MKRAIVDHVHVLVHGERPPTDAEWDDYLATLRQQGPGLVELIVTAGAGPLDRQRARLRELLADRRVPTAILVDGTIARLRIDFWGRVRRRWEVRVYRTDQIVEALAFLGVPHIRTPEIARVVEQLRREAAEPRPALATPAAAEERPR